MKKLILLLIIIGLQSFCFAQNDSNECPAPTKEDFIGLCVSIYEKQMANIPKPGVSYGYQETLWEMSCAKPGFDTIETAKVKIQKMWNKHRESMRCYGYPGFTASEDNIAKFSAESGFTTFLTEAVKRYNLDMNFIDPGDGKTVLDFIKEQETYVRSTPRIDTAKADEYQRIYQLLKSKGAKHRRELNQPK